MRKKRIASYEKPLCAYVLANIANMNLEQIQMGMELGLENVPAAPEKFALTTSSLEFYPQISRMP